MERREVLRLLATGLALQLAPRSLLAALREAHAELRTQTGLRTLDSHQNATVTAISEMIIPRSETPGATDVGVNQFIDLILTEWYSEEERDHFLNGLADVDLRTQSLFEKKFIDCSPRQRAEILAQLGEQMIEEAETVGDHARAYRGSLPKPENNFYYIMRSLTLTGYYTSQEGAIRELGFQVVPEHYDSCADQQEARKERQN
jgi:gluconate 2-dehydrogenase gamma chain